MDSDDRLTIGIDFSGKGDVCWILFDSCLI